MLDKQKKISLTVADRNSQFVGTTIQFWNFHYEVGRVMYEYEVVKSNLFDVKILNDQNTELGQQIVALTNTMVDALIQSTQKLVERKNAKPNVGRIEFNPEESRPE